MRKVLTVLVCLFVIGACAVYSFWQLWLKEKVHTVIDAVAAEQSGNGKRQVKVVRPEEPDDPNFGSYHDPILNEIDALHADVMQHFTLRDFAGLDALADDLRTKRARFGNGSWKIAQFYDALEMPAKATDDAWTARLAALHEWQEKQPTSITARVTLASALVDYAWKARGTDYANTVKEQGWKLFGERLKDAWKVLTEARQLSTKDPYWWSVAHTVALGQGWERADYEKLFNEAIAFEPEYWGYYTNKSYYLVPRWYGQPGDWERFAEESIAQPGGLGPELYTRIVMARHEDYQNIFHESKARWNLTKAGFDKMRERYPDATDILSKFAIIATQGNDPNCSREMFDTLGDRIDRRVWRSKGYYMYYFRYSHPGGK